MVKRTPIRAAAAGSLFVHVEYSLSSSAAPNEGCGVPIPCSGRYRWQRDASVVRPQLSPLVPFGCAGFFFSFEESHG